MSLHCAGRVTVMGDNNKGVLRANGTVLAGAKRDSAKLMNV